jgi:Periplasmic copper-binding protein (NosD)
MFTIAGSRLMRAMTLLGGIGLVAASLFAIATPAQAAVALKCGATITRSVTLSQNIDCTHDSADDGVTIGAADVTINLNGHKILGPGDLKDTGGIVDNGHDNLTITGGTISNFWYGVTVSGTSITEVTGLRIRNATITENTLGDQNYGVSGTDLSRAVMTGLTINGANIGIQLTDSQHSTVTDSHLASPLTGFHDVDGTGNAWTHSTMSNVSDIGVSAVDTIKVVVSFDTITGGANAIGVEVGPADDSFIAHNKLDDLNTGIDLPEVIEVAPGRSTRATTSRSTAPTTGGSADATISDNSGTGDGYGIYADGPTDETYVGNTFNGGQYGIETDYPQGVTIKLNTTDRNSEAGVYVFVRGTATGYSAVLSHNTADKNRFGLYSLIRTTGGSNRAAGNTIVNCHNVSCPKA